MKRCSRCKTEKPLADFAKHSRTKDGKQNYCKACSQQYVREWEAANVERVAAKRARNLAEAVSGERTKVCKGCTEEKSLLEFYAHRSTRDRRATHCKACQRERQRAERTGPGRERYLAYLKEWREGNDDRHRAGVATWRLGLYGLTPDDYNAMLAAQGDRCAICDGIGEGTGRPLGVDHCHETNAVRGLLCNRCNSMLGFARDNEEVLLAAVEYLRRSRAIA